ncbi:hypothetical protein PSEUDO8O_120487 [Pseudomonas sp. 8O]|nr:hypothetical protein PSEUDO8O_120487 [Pseudomonas sp. 8O]
MQFRSGQRFNKFRTSAPHINLKITQQKNL